MDLDWLDLPGADWTARLDLAVGAAFQQSAAYALAARACGARVRQGLLSRHGREVGLVQVLDRPGLRLVLRGPVWTGDPSPALRRRALCRLGRHPGLTVATPDVPLAGPGLVPLVTARHHAVWNIAADAEQLRAALDPRWRGALTAAKRRGLRFALNRAGALDALLAAEAAQRSQRGYRALPAAFTRALPTKALRVWDWQHEGQIAAAMCILRHGRTATYHLAWADPAARKAAVHQAMLWQAALALRAEGVRRLDLGDVNTEEAPGLARFKLGTGAALHRLGATVWVLPR